MAGDDAVLSCDALCSFCGLVQYLLKCGEMLPKDWIAFFGHLKREHGWVEGIDL